MRYAFLWGLHCDQVLSMTSGFGQQQFNTFLQQGEAGITEVTYLLGAAIPGRFCPNFGFRFNPHNNVWPTKSNPIEHFTADFLVSLEARDCKPMTIEVHGDRWALISSLLTRDQLILRVSLVPPSLGNQSPDHRRHRILPPSLPDPIPDNLPGTAQPPFHRFDGQHQVRTPHAGHSGLPPPAPLPGLHHPFIPQQFQRFSPPPIRQSTPLMDSGDTPFNHSS
jgi:hypothetical protein